MELEHVNSITPERLTSYNNKKEEDIAPFRCLFGHLEKERYVAPDEGNWTHDDNNSEDETEKMKKFIYSKSKRIKKEEDSQDSQKKRKHSMAKKVINVEKPMTEEEVVVSATSNKEKFDKEKFNEEQTKSNEEVPILTRNYDPSTRFKIAERQ
ncbi:hypothetical protein Hanom_Chr12g01151241 [Helianthus anomalus]